MVARTIRMLVLFIAVPAAALAADGQRTTLGCTIGDGSGTDRQIEIRNGTGQALKAETVINYDLYWKKPTMQGESAGNHKWDVVPLQQPNHLAKQRFLLLTKSRRL